MPRKETLDDFVRNIGKFDKDIQTKTLNEWSINTELVKGSAQERAPLTTGNLMNSINAIRAKITKDGIESYVIAKAPYARTLEVGITSKGKKITLKNEGEISYYYGGNKRTKKRKGEIGYIGKSINEYSDKFIQDLKKSISEAWGNV